MADTATEAAAAHHEQSFLRKYIFSTDHKIIGIQYFLTAGFMGVLGAFLAGLIRIQRTWPTTPFPFLESIFPTGYAGGFMSPEFYISLVTMHGTIMIFFFISLGLIGAFGNYLIPLMVGARDMAFPFLNMLSYWTIVPAILIAAASFFVEGGAAGTGWTAYPPLSAIPTASPGSGLGQDPVAPRGGAVHLLFHDGRPELRHDGVQPPDQGHEADADAAYDLEPPHRVDHRPARLSAADGRRDPAPPRPPPRHELLSARRPLRRRRGPAERRRLARFCGSTCSGSSAIPRSTC